jgi:hypothetical protein
MTKRTLTTLRGLLSVERDMLGFPRFRWNLRPVVNRLVLRLLDDEALRRALAKEMVRSYMRGSGGR